MAQSLSALELTKSSINPYDGSKVFARLAEGTVADITPEDDVIMRWHGLYRHRPVEAGLFMLRLKLPGGAITSEQLATAARLAERYSHGRLNLTTRQDLELHWLTLADLPAVFAALEAVGLPTLGSCGDQVRNVVGCPVAGLDPDEVFDTSPVVRALTEAFLANPAFANLPRKFKIGVSGCAQGCVPVAVNDFSLLAVRDADGEPAFALYVGGGLSARPTFAANLRACIAPNEAVEVVTRVVEIFRDHGNREHRGKARMKHLIAEKGLPWFRTELEARLGRVLPSHDGDFPRSTGLDHLGVQPQQGGTTYIGIPIPAGRLDHAQASLLAELASSFGHGGLRMTLQQNIILPDVPTAQLSSVLAQLAAVGLPVSPNSWRGRLVACTGKEFCNKSLAHTKELALRLADALDRTATDLVITLRMSGCPNGCGLHALADIGLSGAAVKGEGGTEERFDLWVGGGRTEHAPAFAQRIHSRLQPDTLETVIIDLLQRYRQERMPEESFSAYAQRVLWLDTM